MKVTKTYSIEIKGQVFDLTDQEFNELMTAMEAAKPRLAFERPFPATPSVPVNPWPTDTGNPFKHTNLPPITC